MRFARIRAEEKEFDNLLRNKIEELKDAGFTIEDIKFSETVPRRTGGADSNQVLMISALILYSANTEVIDLDKS